LVTVLAALLLGACRGPEGSSATTSSATTAAPEGRIAWPKEGNLWVMDVASKQPRKIISLPRGAEVTGAAWSPDGSQVVYAQFGRREGETITGADLWVANADGSNARIFAERDGNGTMLEAPTWTPSGRVYYTSRAFQAGKERLSLLRKVEGGAPETVLEGGFNAAVLPDESAIVYLRNSGLAQSLRKKRLDAGGTDCLLLPDTVFAGVGLPRVSPDGTRLAFAASGEAAPAAGDCAQAVEVPARRPANLTGALHLAEWLGLAPRTAWAHGLPWDIWTMNMDGTGLTRVAVLQEDEPNVAWAPDGTQIAVFGASALYLVDVRGGQAQQIDNSGGYGALDWTR
jgi:hypothetical protein